jgi:DNA-binding NarL/FixJ family response regulator
VQTTARVNHRPPETTHRPKRRIIELLQQGFTYSEIGETMSLSSRTVRWHVGGIADTLSTTGAIADPWELRKCVRDGADTLLDDGPG